LRISLTLVVILLVTPAIAQQKYFDWDTLWAERKGWEVGRNRESAACIATNTEADGTMLWYGFLPEGTKILAFSERGWAVEPGAQLTGTLTFDHQRTLEAMGSAFNGGERSGIVIEQVPPGIAQEFEQSRELNFSFGEGLAGNFALIGTAAAGLMLKECILLD
jgi:hypothetical protein